MQINVGSVLPDQITVQATRDPDAPGRWTGQVLEEPETTSPGHATPGDAMEGALSAFADVLVCNVLVGVIKMALPDPGDITG